MTRAELLYADEVFRITGCAMEVLNTLGHGFNEKPYENALAIEFGLQGIPFQQQPRFPMAYKSAIVGEYVPDLVAFQAIIVDTKSIKSIGEPELGQMLNYLRITGLRLGLILNFKHAKLQWKRVVL